MPISKIKDLQDLVISMTKGEKRNFTLYVKRNNKGASPQFIKLFQWMERQPDKSDEWYQNKLKLNNKQNYLNLKRHLYKQIVLSLRILNNTKRANILVREYIDYAFLLYGKGLYSQASKILNLAKRDALKHHLNNSLFTIIEFQKKIESRHITRSGPESAKELIDESAKVQKRMNAISSASNLRLEIHAYFIKNGHVKSEAQKEKIIQKFGKRIEKIKNIEASLNQQIFKEQAIAWYYYALNDFEESFKAAQKWVRISEENPELIVRDQDLYMRGFHYLLNCTFHMRKAIKQAEVLEKFEEFRTTKYKTFNRNSQIVSFIYVHSGRLNRAILQNDIDYGLSMIPRTVRRVNRYMPLLDEHRLHVFYFKIAWIYLCDGQVKKAISYLNRIVNFSKTPLRSDLKKYSILMFMICHYENGNVNALEYFQETFEKQFKSANAAQRLTFEMFEELAKANKNEMNAILTKTKKEMKRIKKSPFLTLSINYLNVELWIESRLQNKRMRDL